MAHVAAVGAPRSERGCAAIAARHAGRPRDPRRRADLGHRLDRPAAPVVEAALERGLLVNRTSDTVDPAAAAVRDHRPAKSTKASPLLEAGDRHRHGGTGMNVTLHDLRTRPRTRRPSTGSSLDNLEAGHLLPRSLEDVAATRPASSSPSRRRRRRVRRARAAQPGVAEVRSLVVDERVPRPPHRSAAGRAARHAAAPPRASATLCAFTHEPVALRPARASPSCRTSGCRRRSRATAVVRAVPPLRPVRA